MTRPGPEPPAGSPQPGREIQRIVGAALAGALFAAAAAAVLGLALDLLPHAGSPARAAEALRGFLNAGGWARVPLAGASLGALRALAWSREPRTRALALALVLVAFGLAVLPRAYAPAPAGLPEGAGRPGAPPRSGRGGSGVAAKSMAIRRGAYASLAGVREILALGADPSPLIREQAALALGVNLVVSDIEHAEPDRPSRYESLALRDSLRLGLMILLRDSVEAVRAEAARALWKAPRTFGTVPAAAETLAAVLGRAGRPGVPERLAWLALDAAAGAPHPGLRGAAARFAATTRDSELGRAARLAAGEVPRPRGRP